SSRIGPAINDGDARQNVIHVLLSPFNENIEVAVFAENSRIDQLILKLRAAARPGDLNHRLIREFELRVLVQVLHVRMRGDVVEIEVILLDVLAMVALVSAEAE